MNSYCALSYFMDIEELYLIADELRALANMGLQFAEIEYDQERYHKALELSARLAAALENSTPAAILEDYNGNLQHFSPLIAVDAVVLHQGKLLLIQRTDTRLWATPGGLSDVGETLAESVLRELYEETGVIGKVQRLLGVFDSRLWESRTKFHLYHILFQVQVEDPKPTLSNETLDVGFFPLDDLPPLSQGHDLRLPMILKMLDGQLPIPYYDLPEMQI